MKTLHSRTHRRKPSTLKIASYVGIAAGALVLVCVLVLLLFPGPFLNTFVSPRITTAFAEAYPAYTLQLVGMKYNIFTNRLAFDSVSLSAIDSTFAGSTGSISVRGIGWTHLLRGGSLAPNDLASAVVDAHNLVLNLPRDRYKFQCGMLRVSVPDSTVDVQAMKIHPSDDDEAFFAGSKFRQTRFRLSVPEINVAGLACFDLLQGKAYHARYVGLHDAFLDVLINKDKAFLVDSASPSMPNEMLASIKGTVGIDSVSMVNTRLKYGERFAVGSPPAVIAFDSMLVHVGGISNQGDHGPVVIHARGIFMNTGAVRVRMSIPVALPDFSYQFSGSVGSMNLTAFNAFLERAEQMRIKEGLLQSATFEVNVNSGRASGKVRPVYSGLTLAAINKTTGSEKGLSDGITSFIANAFKIRGTNQSDHADSLKTGEVKYTRKRGEFFMEFTWFALRSGLGDVVGF